MSILSTFRKKKRKLDDLISKGISPNLTRFQRYGVYLDYLWEIVIRHNNQPNYFLFGFYWKTNQARRQFICRGQMHKIYAVCNALEARVIARDKAAFNQRCGEYLGRRWMDASEATFEEFCSFIQGFDRLFYKEKCGERGMGNRLVEINQIADLREFYEEARRKAALLEEVVSQHPEMASLNPTSVNTVRIVTLRDADDQLHVVGVSLRIGREGKCVDNFHQGGIAAVVDEKFGVVVSPAMDLDFHRFYFHPDNGTKLIGFQIPNWDNLLGTVSKAAALIPELRYVGWDMAVDRNGQAVIIEANATPDAKTLQAPAQVGLWPKVKPLIQELERRGLSQES